MKTEDALVTVITLALGPHTGHDGIPGAEDDSCFRCNAERALEDLHALYRGRYDWAMKEKSKAEAMLHDELRSQRGRAPR